MSHVYTSVYPTIIIDDRPNSVNDSMQKKITVEEYYDLMHHTHDISSLTNNNGMTYDEIVNTINELKSTIAEQQKIINNLSNDIANLNNEVSNMPPVSDWDVETPGIQDANGNDLGTIMGFDVTEIE